MNLNHHKHTVLAAMIAVVVSGCQSLPALDEIVEDNTQKYRSAKVMPPLEIPADLSREGLNDSVVNNQVSANSPSGQEETTTPLATNYTGEPKNKPVLVGEGSKRHLTVSGNRSAIWQHLLDFWQYQELPIRRMDERIGLMDTEPDAEDYAYRIRMERGKQTDTVDIYISEAKFESNSEKNEAMLRQLADYLGAVKQTQQSSQPQQVKPQQTAQSQTQQYIQPAQPQYVQPKPVAIPGVKVILVDEASDHYALIVEQGLNDTWRSVGQVLDSKEFSIEDRERSRGVYFIRYSDPFNNVKPEGSILGNLAFWRSAEDKAPQEFYYIQLLEDNADTKVIVLDVNQIRTSSETARRILELIQEKLVK